MAADELPSELGPRIRQARQEQGVSLRALASKVGVSPSLLSQLENGLARPSVATLWALVTELGLSLQAPLPGFEDAANRLRRVRPGEDPLPPS